jgi:hypothetical protein
VLRFFEQHRVVDGEEVEGDEAGGRGLGEHLDPRRRGMHALAQEVEVLTAVGGEDDDLAVQHVAPRGEGQVGEVPGQRLAVARLDVHRLAVHEDDRAEAVPLGLIRPAAGLDGQGLGRFRQLRQGRNAQGQSHASGTLNA